MSDQRKVYRRVFSFLLIGVGIAGDVIAGFVILGHQAFPGAMLHLVATFVWSLGIAVGCIRRPTGTEDVEQSHPGQLAGGYRIILTRLNEAHLTPAIALGLCLFPGLGPLGFTLAFGMAYGLGGHPQTATNEPAEFAFPELEAEIRAAIQAPLHPLVELEVQPLVEILNTTDFNAKRAALDLICREGGSEALSLARSLLTDSDPEVRGLAAVAVARLEAHFSEQLKEARQDKPSQPAEYYGALGRLYCRHARAGAPDSPQRRFHLIQARQALDQAISLDSTRWDDQVSLAEVLIELGEGSKAREVVDQVLSQWPGDSAAYLLGAEIAFRERRFDQVVALAEQAGRVLAENDESLPIVAWWLEAKPAR